jgi:hypothetical protein
VSAWSPGREVRVTVDHSGILTDIEFEEKALITSPLALSRAVTATVQRALADLQQKVLDVARDVAGEDSDLALSVEREYRSAFERRLPPERPEA